MESSGYIVPSTSRINEHEVALIELVEHGGTGAAACIYADESGKRRYVTLDDWIKAVAPSHAVTSHSPAADKIALFQSLFQGREMFAKGFPVDGGKIGYYPICLNRKTTACPKKHKNGFKCVDCTHQDFPPLDKTTLLAHFSNRAHPFRDVVGMYVMDEESRTHVFWWATLTRLDGSKRHLPSPMPAANTASTPLSNDRDRATARTSGCFSIPPFPHRLPGASALQ